MSAELERARRAEPAWDEVRERRVLARVLAEKHEGARRRARARIAVGAGAVAIAAAVALAWIVREPDAPLVAESPPAEVVAPEPTAPGTGRIALRDGSEVELGEDARVEIEVQGPVEVRIAQHAGRARYVVSHRPERAFVVVAGDVEVVVRGTRFVVQVAPPWAEVEVEEGRVEVRRAGEVRALSIGESMRVPLVDPETEAEAETATESETAPPVVRRRERAEEREIAIETLLGQADEARRAGRLDDAARALRAAIGQHREDPRVATALFTLGRVERSRGRDVAAAEAFESAYERDPGAILAEDALAESAVSWAAAGRPERARSAAQRYLARHPAGEYVDRVRHLAE